MPAAKPADALVSRPRNPAPKNAAYGEESSAAKRRWRPYWISRVGTDGYPDTLTTDGTPTPPIVLVLRRGPAGRADRYANLHLPERISKRNAQHLGVPV